MSFLCFINERLYFLAEPAGTDLAWFAIASLEIFSSSTYAGASYTTWDTGSSFFSSSSTSWGAWASYCSFFWGMARRPPRLTRDITWSDRSGSAGLMATSTGLFSTTVWDSGASCCSWSEAQLEFTSLTSTSLVILTGDSGTEKTNDYLLLNLLLFRVVGDVLSTAVIVALSCFKSKTGIDDGNSCCCGLCWLLRGN